MARKSGSRYLNILRGKRGPSAKTKLLQYLAGEIDVNYPARQVNRPAVTIVWVKPFGLPVAADVKLAQDTYATTAFLAFGGTYVSTTAPAEGKQLVVKGLLAPRAAITTGRSAGEGTQQTSKLSGLRYRKYGGKSAVVPFGEGTTAEDKNEDVVFRKIRAEVKKDASNLCSFVPGSYSV